MMTRGRLRCKTIHGRRQHVLSRPTAASTGRFTAADSCLRRADSPRRRARLRLRPVSPGATDRGAYRQPARATSRQRLTIRFHRSCLWPGRTPLRRFAAWPEFRYFSPAAFSADDDEAARAALFHLGAAGAGGMTQSSRRRASRRLPRRRFGLATASLASQAALYLPSASRRHAGVRLIYH